jgi:RimJ/RimL family protein N-acetyltransferase
VRLRPLRADDAAFMLALLNDEGFLRHVGDRGVRTVEAAAAYIDNGARASYQRYGFGLYLVERRETAEPIGICGLVKRDLLPQPDLGFALLPRFRSAGYAREAAQAVLAHARGALGLTRILAITSLDNAASIALLGTLGFRFEGNTRLTPDGEELRLFAWEATGDGPR